METIPPNYAILANPLWPNQLLKIVKQRKKAGFH